MSVGRNTGRVPRQTLSGRLRSGGRSGAAYGRTAGQQDEGEQRPIDDAVRSMDSAAARFKQMSAVTAAAVAVAVVAVGYGLWQAGASRAAVDQATKGARSVVVTTRDVAAGDPLGADAVQLVEVPQAFRQDDALGADALDGAGSVAGARALVSIPANTQLSPQMIAGSAADGRLAAQLAAGMEAVSLSVNDETGVAGQVQPFDEVRVVCVTEAAGGAVSLDELCASARVMSVGGDGAGEGAAYSAITLELTPEQADAVRCAQASGTISVQLVAGGMLSGGMVEHGGIGHPVACARGRAGVEPGPCRARRRSLVPLGRRRFPSLRPFARAVGGPWDHRDHRQWRWRGDGCRSCKVFGAACVRGARRAIGAVPVRSVR